MCEYHECQHNDDFVCFYDWDNGLPEFCFEIEAEEIRQARRLTYPLLFALSRDENLDPANELLDLDLPS